MQKNIIQLILYIPISINIFIQRREERKHQHQHQQKKVEHPISFNSTIYYPFIRIPNQKQIKSTNKINNRNNRFQGNEGERETQRERNDEMIRLYFCHFFSSLVLISCFNKQREQPLKLQQRRGGRKKQQIIKHRKKQIKD